MSKKRKQKPAEPVERETGAITYRLSSSPFGGLTFSFGTIHRAGDDAPLREAVAKQIESILPTDLDTAPAELPVPEPDLTTYRDAFASARKKCKHEDAVNTLHGRQWVCDACGRTLSRDDMRRAGSLPWWAQ